MEITALLMAGEMALRLASVPATMPQKAPLRVAVGMAKADVIRAIGEPYNEGYSMYAGDYLSYRGNMCAEGTCQVWLKDGVHVSSTKGMK